MARSAVLSLKITGDASSSVRALGETEAKAAHLSGVAGKLGGVLGKLGTALAGAFAVGQVIDFGKATFDAASNLEQMAGSVDAVFGKFAGNVHAQAQDAATAVGLSEAAYSQMASVLGSQLKNAGVSGQALSDQVYDLITKGSDMAAVFGGTTADAVEALTATMRGEFDPIEKYGVSLNQTTVNAALAAKGQDKLTGAALRNAKVATTLGLITKQTALTTGQFAAQGNTAAEQSQKLSAWFENLKAKIGAGLLPAFVGLTNWFSKRVEPALDGLFRKGGPVNTMFTKMARFLRTDVLPTLSSLWNWLKKKVQPSWTELSHALTTKVVPALKGVWQFVKQYVIPIVKDVMGPAIDGSRKLWEKMGGAIDRNKDSFKKALDNAKPLLDFLRDKVAPVVGTAVFQAFDKAAGALGNLVDALGWMLKKEDQLYGFLDKLKDKLNALPNLNSPGGIAGWITGKIGSLLGAPAGGGGAAPRAATFGAARGATLFGATSSLSGGGAGPSASGRGTDLPGATTINITVQGAVDPMSTAKQIQSLLDRYAVRTGARPAVAR